MKSRIKNVLNYKKPAFWVGIVALVSVICVILGLMVNPKANSLPDQEEVTSIRIEQINEGSSLGFIETTTVSDIEIILTSLKHSDKTLRQSVNDSPDRKNYFQINIAVSTAQTLYLYNDNNQYYIVEPYSGIYKTNRETSVTIAKVYTANGGIYAEYNTTALWNARIQYIGNNSTVGNLIGLLPVPMGSQYDHFELQTASQPYKVKIVYSVPTGVLAEYGTENSSVANSFRANALLLLSLIKNADEIQATLTDGSRKVSSTNGREWADHTVGGDVRDYAQSPEKLQELIDFIGWKITAETVTAEYSIMKLGKNGKVLSEYSSENRQLVEAIIMNALVKSAAWEGVDITTLEECYHIRQTFPEAQEIHDYYAYA